MIYLCIYRDDPLTGTNECQNEDITSNYLLKTTAEAEVKNRYHLLIVYN